MKPVIDPYGDVVTAGSLPKVGERWVPRRKAQLVLAVKAGLISLDDALSRYRLSPEEYLSWAQSFEQRGIDGLKTTKVQAFRRETE